MVKNSLLHDYLDVTFSINEKVLRCASVYVSYLVITNMLFPQCLHFKAFIAKSTPLNSKTDRL